MITGLLSIVTSLDEQVVQLSLTLDYWTVGTGRND
jgi:hypothetical protein